MKKYILILTIAIALIGGVSKTEAYGRHHRDYQPPTPVVIPTPTSTPSGVLWGAYTGGTDQSMSAFEAQVGKKMNIDAIFWGWDSAFPASGAGAQGKTLLVFWEPSFGYAQINNGSKDAYIKQFAAGAKAYGYPVILVPMDEFNLNETAYGNTINGNTPAGFIAAWQRIKNIFDTVGAGNIKFGLDYNNISIPSVPFTDFYPGGSFVDYIGIDGFDFGGTTYANQMNQAIASAESFGKPVYIMSTGSVSPQTSWIQALGAQQGIAGWVWFNQSPFNITGSSLPAFQAIIK